VDKAFIKKNTRDLENFVQKAKRKLLEFEVMQSEWEHLQNKSKIFSSASGFMRHIKSSR
jgi:predicted patatin/cPLA2 family phospholipase